MTHKQLEILIIEDERTSADRLYRQLKKLEPAAAVYGPVESIGKAVEWFEANKTIDIILADIRLDDGLSFDALRYAPSNATVIFTTAYDEYAIKAFKYNSIDYLLKPISLDELADAISKAKKHLMTSETSTIESLLSLIDRSKGKYRERFLVPCNDGYITVDVNDIAYFYTENKEVRLVTPDSSSKTVSHSMEDLEKQLDPHCFFRANRQYIVSVGSVEKLANNFGGRYKLILRTNPKVEIPISKEKAPLLKSWLDR